jgi:3-deoxy-D-manno-octulosonic-acid transferase
LAEALIDKYPEHLIVLTFFSPSGYEPFRNWPGAAVVCYLPLDTKKNARDFLSIVQPSAAVFIKYEFWVNFLFALKSRGIKTYLVSAVFKPHHPFFRYYGGIFRRSLGAFTRLMVQEEASARLLESIGITNCEVCGDTRYDRVLEIKSGFREIPVVRDFKGSARLIVAGSTWPGDEALVLDAFARLNDKEVKLLVAPHNVDERSIRDTIGRINEKGLSYSLFSSPAQNNASIMVMDAMGILSRAYYYGDCAYVGGGFNNGLHNTIEPAVYGIPVIFYGNDYNRYNEAADLVSIGAARNVNSAKELDEALKTFLYNQVVRQKIAASLEQLFRKNMNVTGRVIAAIQI